MQYKIIRIDLEGTLTINGSSGSSFGINIVQYPFTMYSKKVFQIAQYQLCKYCNVQEPQGHWPAPTSIHVQSLVLCKNKLCANFVQEAMPLKT